MPGTAADCGAIGPKVDASRISSQASARQRRSPPQLADRRPRVGDPRERPQVAAPHTPEPPLSDRDDTLHARAPYGRGRRVNRTIAVNRDGGERHANSGCNRTETSGMPILPPRSHYALRRGCSELSGHCPQADPSLSGRPWSRGSSARCCRPSRRRGRAQRPRPPSPDRHRTSRRSTRHSRRSARSRATLAQEEQQTSILDDKYNTAVQNLQNAQSTLAVDRARASSTRGRRSTPTSGSSRRTPSRRTSTARPRPASRPTSRRRPR